MITVFCGDDTVSSRKAYSGQIELLKKENEIEFVLAKDIDKTKIENIFGSTDLFGKVRVLVTENLFSGPKNKTGDEIVLLLAQRSSDGNRNEVVVDWEEKELSKAEITKLGKNAIIKNLKLPNVLFSFLDGIAPGNVKENLQMFHKVLENSEPHSVFSMIIRQIRLLLLACDDELDSLAPWQAEKIKKQSKLFTKEKLILIFIVSILTLSCFLSGKITERKKKSFTAGPCFLISLPVASLNYSVIF